MKEKIGVYFSASDQVLPWAIAFLNSFRRFNPELPLYLIPFNEQCDELKKLQEQYQFGIYESEEFARLEKIGQDFELGHTHYGPYWFRRYAAFWGPLTSFIYLDARQLILTDIQHLVEAPQQYDFDLLFYDCAINQVYEPGSLRQTFLRQKMGRGFNSGRWASKRGLFTIDDFEKLGAEAMTFRDQLNPRNTDQAFINYCCDARQINYGQFAELLGSYCQQGWAGQRGRVYLDKGQYRLWDHGGLDHKKVLFLLHWGGIQLSPLMPERKLFLEFFNNQALATQVNDLVKTPVASLYNYFRKSRRINTFYHNR